MRYDYKCVDCDQQFVVKFPIATNPPEVQCESCFGTAVRDFTAGMPQVQFAGWGWNSTDKLHPMDPENNNPYPVPPVSSRPYLSRKRNSPRSRRIIK